MAEDHSQELANLYVEPAGEINADNTTWDSETGTYEFEARAAVKLVLNDTETADTFLNILQWAKQSWPLLA